jgi:hypothetical protein
VPNSAQAAFVFLVLFVPGFLYMGGYRLGRAVPEQRDGIGTIAKVIAISAIIAVIGWKLGGRDLYDDAQAATALTSDEGDTWRFTIAALVIPGLLGFTAGELVDAAARRVGQAQDRRRHAELAEDEPPKKLRWRKRASNKALDVMSARLLHEGPSTWDRAWRHLRRTEDYVYVRVVTKGGREIIGTMTDRSRIALSPQPRDLYIEQVLRPATDGNYYPTAYGLGAFVAGSEIETVEWVSPKGLLTVTTENNG